MASRFASRIAVGSVVVKGARFAQPEARSAKVVDSTATETDHAKDMRTVHYGLYHFRTQIGQIARSPPACRKIHLTMRLPFRRISFATLAVFVGGCGGSGGGSTPPSNNGVLVTTSWTNTGQSERVSIVLPNGSVGARTIINAAAKPTGASLVAPATGSYVVLVEEADGPNFTGAVVGNLSVGVPGGSTAFSVAQGSTSASLRISPDNVTINYGQAIGLGVAGANSAGIYTFLTPNNVTYSSSGSTATVSSSGVVTGASSAGSTSVTATYSPSSLSATAIVNVHTASVVHTKWTVMVFLNASNDLWPYALPNVQQMASVAYNSDVRFILQWKEAASVGGSGVDFDGTRRYLVTTSTPPGSTIPAQLIQNLGSGVDMGEVSTLQTFVTWAKQNYPADRYACVVWDHGSGWAPAVAAHELPKTRAVSYDTQTGHAINIWDLPSAFTSQPVDIISFDACLMQMLEVEDELKSSCSYIATSEDNTPGPGYPYDRVFGAFANNPSASTTTLSQSFVTGQTGNPPYQTTPVTQSVVSASDIAGIEPALDSLAGALIAERPNILAEIPIIRNAMTMYAPGDGYYYYDLEDLANHLIADGKIPNDVKTAAQGVITAVQAAVLWNGFTAGDGQSHGIAIDFSPSTNPALASYANLSIAKETRWLDWLKVAP
jgi:hypothetical protein